ncbi:MAG: YtxH protein [Sphingobacteriaceae bacterium]|jgi:gas vesicle protein|nr:YtxH protein [Sphingobacteriaceae bacterium]
MSDNSKIATVVLAGLAAGAAAWYLLATEDGKATTDKLVDSLKNLGGTFNDIKEKASDTLNNLTDQAGKVAENLKTKTESAYSNV